MRTDVLRESLRERSRSIVWWTLGLVLLIGVNVAFYPSVRDDEALGDYAKDLPESLRALFAGGELDLASPVGYLNSQVFALTAPLVLFIFAIGAGSGAVAGEEEKGTPRRAWAGRRRTRTVATPLAVLPGSGSESTAKPRSMERLGDSRAGHRLVGRHRSDWARATRPAPVAGL